MRTPRRTWQALATLALALSAGFAGAEGTNPGDVVERTLHAQYPQLKIEDVRPAPIPGWYEVFTGSELVYSDATGDHVFVGKLIDTHTRKDLAEESLENRLTIDFQKLPFDRAIKLVKGDGTRRLALFEDPDCPYCQQFEHELANVNNVTLYVFLFPLSDLHPQARVHAHSIWCAPDRAGAWSHWMLEHKDPGSPECGGDPIDQLQTLGAGLNVTATPTLFLPNGRRVQGVLAGPKLEELLTSLASDAAAASNRANSTSPASANQRADAVTASGVGKVSPRS
jgi:thiol:disulfide interchange protein DsbC